MSSLISFSLAAVTFAVSATLLFYNPTLFFIALLAVWLTGVFILLTLGLKYNVVDPLHYSLTMLRQRRFRSYLEKRAERSDYRVKEYVFDTVYDEWISGPPSPDESDFVIRYYPCRKDY